MSVVRRAVLILPLAVASCQPTIDNRNDFCSATENKAYVPYQDVPQTRFIVAKVGGVTLWNNETRTFDKASVTLRVQGGSSASSETVLAVCAGDCLTYGDAAFGREAKATTDDHGVLIYTVLAGRSTVGFVLEDWGQVTCIQGVGATFSDDGGVTNADAATNPDLTMSVDLRMSTDMGTASDLAGAPDLASMRDLASSPDLVVVRDLATAPDLATPPDLAVAADLATPPDLATPDDLSEVADLVAVADMAVAVDLSMSDDLSDVPDLVQAD